MRPLHAKQKLILGKMWTWTITIFGVSIFKEKILHKEKREHSMIHWHGKFPKSPYLKQLSEAYSAKLQGTHWICRKR